MIYIILSYKTSHWKTKTKIPGHYLTGCLASNETAAWHKEVYARKCRKKSITLWARFKILLSKTAPRYRTGKDEAPEPITFIPTLCLLTDLELTNEARLAGQWTSRSICLSLPAQPGEHKCKLPSLAFWGCWGARSGLPEWAIGALPTELQSQLFWRFLKSNFSMKFQIKSFFNSKSTSICLCYSLKMIYTHSFSPPDHSDNGHPSIKARWQLWHREPQQSRAQGDPWATLIYRLKKQTQSCKIF